MPDKANDFQGCNDCDPIEGCTHHPADSSPNVPAVTQAFATITGEIGIIDAGGYQLQLRATVQHPTKGKVVIASAAINMMTLEIGERFLLDSRKVAQDAITQQRERQKKDSERRIEVVTRLPRSKRTIW
jgi:hypothetical protein